MWVWIWIILSLATLGGATLLLLGLWRQLKGALREAGSSAERFGEAMSGMDDAVEARLAAQPDTGPTIGAERAVLHARLDATRAVRAQAKAARRRPRPDVYARWLSAFR